MAFKSIEVCKITARVCVLLIAGIGFSAVIAGCASEDIGSTSPSWLPFATTGKDHPSKGDHPDHPSNEDHPDHPSNGDHPDHPDS